MAAELALLLRRSTIEYRWEQDEALLPSLDVDPDDVDIIGTNSPDPDSEDDLEVAFIVFGGVVRGEKGTGLLSNGKVRISTSQVVARKRSHAV